MQTTLYFEAWNPNNGVILHEISYQILILKVFSSHRFITTLVANVHGAVVTDCLLAADGKTIIAVSVASSLGNAFAQNP